jgi:hypothetical protein
MIVRISFIVSIGTVRPNSTGPARDRSWVAYRVPTLVGLFCWDKARLKSVLWTPVRQIKTVPRGLHYEARNQETRLIVSRGSIPRRISSSRPRLFRATPLAARDRTFQESPALSP